MQFHLLVYIGYERELLSRDVGGYCLFTIHYCICACVRMRACVRESERALVCVRCLCVHARACVRARARARVRVCVRMYLLT